MRCIRSCVWLLLAGCTPASLAIEVPESVGYAAWIELSANGESVRRSTPLFPAVEAQTWVVDDGRRMVLVGFETAQLADTLANVEWRSGALEGADDCDDRLGAPSWVHAVDGRTTMPGDVPSLTSGWVADACDASDGAAGGVRCAPCEQTDCPGLIVDAASIEVPDLFRPSLQGVKWVDDGTVFLTNPWGDHQFVFRLEVDMNEPAVRAFRPATKIPIGIDSANSIAWDGRVLTIADDGEPYVVRLDADGSNVRRFEGLPTGLSITGDDGTPTIARHSSGAVFEITETATIPIAGLADVRAIDTHRSGAMAFATNREVTHVVAGQTTTYELPSTILDHLDANPDAGIDLDATDVSIVIATRDVPAFVYETEAAAWRQLEWPFGSAAHRMVGHFAGGVVIAGVSTFEAALFYDRGGTSCYFTRPQPPFNAMDVHPSGEAALLVTSSGSTYPSGFIIREAP